jgi:hypothetical protein
VNRAITGYRMFAIGSPLTVVNASLHRPSDNVWGAASARPDRSGAGFLLLL